MPDGLELATIVAKFAIYLGTLAAAGTVFAALVCRINHYHGLAIFWALLGLIATGVLFMLRAAALTGDVSGMVDLEMLTLVWSVREGTTVSVRAVGLGVLLLGVMRGVGGLWIAVIGGLIALWAFTTIGHVAGQDMLLLKIVLMIHLIVVALWVGILTPLRRLARHPVTLSTAGDVGHRFGLIASVAVPCLLLAGGYIAYVLAGTLTALFTSDYGQVLLIKLVLVAGLLLLGAANKVLFTPALRRGDVKAGAHLATSIRVEWAVFILILFATAVLTSSVTLPPQPM